MRIRKLLSLLLVLVLLFQLTACGSQKSESSTPPSETATSSKKTASEKATKTTESISGWTNQAKEDVSSWTNQAVDDTAEWAGKAKDDVTEWAGQAKEDATEWAGQAKEDATEWVGQAKEDVTEWAGQAKEDATDWADQAKEGVSGWLDQAGSDVAGWTGQAWKDSSSWVVQAWDDSSKWVSKAWVNSTDWTSDNWDNFVIWLECTTSKGPYYWLNEFVLDDGLPAYESLVVLRNFLKTSPSIGQYSQWYDEQLSKLSLLKEDKSIIWDTLQKWSEDKGIPFQQTVELALPYLTRLTVQGESAIGDDVVFSGPVVAQYLLMSLESMKLDSSNTASLRTKSLASVLEGISRPVIIGDSGQNVLVTDDSYCIENFSYADGKYQIILVASEADTSSAFPKMRGNTIDALTLKYFKSATVSDPVTQSLTGKTVAQSQAFSSVLGEDELTGKTLLIWTGNYDYLLFFVTNKDWDESEYSEWFETISIGKDYSINLSVDLESDGSFYGINQTAQRYTINRIFDENRFRNPLTGHGWAAERGNNLIDNIKGVFKGSHSTVIGDNNAKNGADRVTTMTDGSKLFIQTKYYNSASHSIDACFENHQYRYFDAEGNPMSVEVPADQYEAAVSCMKNRIINGEVSGVTDPEEANTIVRKGNLTYQQAKHIAKAGTVESIAYDAAHGCVVAGTSMGIAAALNFALNIWNGEPYDVALKESVFQGLKAGGISFIVSVLSSQLSRTAVSTALIPASNTIVKALGPKVAAAIINAFRPAGSPIYGAAAMNSAAKLLRGSVIASTVSFVVLTVPQVVDIIQGKISWKQLAKNASTTAAGIAGGGLGYLAGAAIGTAILPGAGTVVGLIIGIAAGYGAETGAKALADLIAEDDADEMIRIIETEFPKIAEEYFLTEDELTASVENLQSLITAKMLKEMYQYRDQAAFARQLIELSVDPVVAERNHIQLPDEAEYSTYLTEVLESIYKDIGDETPAA